MLSVGDLRLDPATKRAWRADTEIELSPKEFALLELFLRHPGTVLSRSQIIDAVWDFAYDGTSNVVDQYVNYLRRKVDAPFGRHDLQTVRGHGLPAARRGARADRVHPPPARSGVRGGLRGRVRPGQLAVRHRALVLAAGAPSTPSSPSSSARPRRTSPRPRTGADRPEG